MEITKNINFTRILPLRTMTTLYLGKDIWLGIFKCSFIKMEFFLKKITFYYSIFTFLVILWVNFEVWNIPLILYTIYPQMRQIRKTIATNMTCSPYWIIYKNKLSSLLYDMIKIVKWRNCGSIYCFLPIQCFLRPWHLRSVCHQLATGFFCLFSWF